MSWNPNQGQDPNQGSQYGGGYAPPPQPTDPYSGQQPGLSTTGYQQPGYGQPGYQQPAINSRTINNPAISSLAQVSSSPMQPLAAIASTVPVR